MIDLETYHKGSPKLMLGPDPIGPKLMLGPGPISHKLLDKKRNCSANNFSCSNHFSGETKPDSSGT